eukprot:3180005-Rhodomonas_salina.1
MEGWEGGSERASLLFVYQTKYGTVTQCGRYKRERSPLKGTLDLPSFSSFSFLSFSFLSWLFVFLETLAADSSSSSSPSSPSFSSFPLLLRRRGEIGGRAMRRMRGICDGAVRKCKGSLLDEPWLLLLIFLSCAPSLSHVSSILPPSLPLSPLGRIKGGGSCEDRMRSSRSDGTGTREKEMDWKLEKIKELKKQIEHEKVKRTQSWTEGVERSAASWVG